MSRIIITPEQADAAFTILMEHAGELDNERGDERFSFVYHVAKTSPQTSEYRFMGALGFGGKFRNNGNRPTPYVDCYREDMTPEREAMIQRTNESLAALFAPATVSVF